MAVAAANADALHVAVGVIENDRGQILIAKRQPGVHLEGYWEFPGGKVEAGESVTDALERELREELGIAIRQSSPLIRIRHRYPERRVLLDVWRVEAFEGRPVGLQRQTLRWAGKGELSAVRFPAANRPIATAARLPHRYAILDGDSADLDLLGRRLKRLADNGAQMIQLRASGLRGTSGFRAFARCALDYCRARGIVLLLNADPAMVPELGADGVHLTAAALMALSERPLHTRYWVAASCHTEAELLQAERIQADFVVLSPVATTATHPDRKPLGWAGFSALTERANIPVYALGGLTEPDLPLARQYGAQGIAAIRGFL